MYSSALLVVLLAMGSVGEDWIPVLRPPHLQAVTESPEPLAGQPAGCNRVPPQEEARSSQTEAWYLDFLRKLQKTLILCRKKTRAFQNLDEDYEGSLLKMKHCVKATFLDYLDVFVRSPEVVISPFITMYRENNSLTVDRMDPRQEALDESLLPAVFSRLVTLLETHTFKINFYPWTQEEDIAEGRGRRRRHQYRKAFPMMVAGYMMMSAFLVPLGFQFMAMIGGKALLLAKMAFFMSLFSGYKKLTNDIEYHHQPAPVHHGHDYLHHYGFHHRSQAEEPPPITQAWDWTQANLRNLLPLRRNQQRRIS